MDEYLWLEDVEGTAALSWVRERNEEKARELSARDSFTEVREGIRGALDSDDKIPGVSKIGAYYYNFWRDSSHERGLWRRTTPESYRTQDPEWEVVLDLDALAEAESESWVWHGAAVLREDGGEGPTYRYALVTLSRGGADADVTREFDLEEKAWVEGGFYRPESKGGMGWIDRDTVFVYTDTGPGSLTASGYPRQARRWRRGTPLQEAPIVYEGTAEDMYILAAHDSTPGFERDFVVRSRAFYDAEMYLLEGETLTKIDVPRSAEPGLHREWLIVELREDWAVPSRIGADSDDVVTHAAGSLLAIRWEEFRAGSRDFHALFTPTAATSLAGATWTKNHLILTVLEDVKTRLYILTPSGGSGGGFHTTAFPGLPEVGTVAARAVESKFSDEVWVTCTDFLTPTTLSLASVTPDGEVTREELKSAPAFFDSSGLTATQRFAVSDDGTRVPYFLINRSGGAALDHGGTPTLLYGYGGFEISLTPAYSAALGIGWLERGGAYAVANIRGGGEYGPGWHQAALKENRPKAYEDFAAVARDLVDTGVTTPSQLGIRGGSNGGLLTGNMLVRDPELFGAVVIQVPLLDMKRYSHLLAGSSWMAEYGDPDSADWQFIQGFSPYHLVDADRAYPPVFLLTSTRDDRVHPGHARKMAAKLLAAGKDVTYYENIEGGHGGAATNAQAAHMSALAYEFLATRLGLTGLGVTG